MAEPHRAEDHEREARVDAAEGGDVRREIRSRDEDCVA